MAIRSKNIEDNDSFNEFAQLVIPLPVEISLTTASSVSGAVVRMPWAGKILSAYQGLGTTSGSSSLQVHKNGTAISNAVAGSTTAAALTLSASTFAAGDLLGVIYTAANSAVARGAVTLVVRPYRGVQERVSASLGDS
jgi:hypothetical protein